MSVPGYSREFLINVSRGLTPGVSYDIKFGRNGDIDTGAEEDVINQGGNIFYPTTARTLSIVSADENDDSGSTGCESVTVVGLDANYDVATETVTLDGTTPVVTTTSFIRATRMFCRSCGSSGENEGAITATYTTDAQTALVIAAGVGQSEFGALTIPDGKVMLPLEVSGSVVKSSGGANAVRAARLYAWARLYNPLSNNNYECWRRIFEIILNQDGSSSVQQNFAIGNVFPARADLRFSAVVSADDTEVSDRTRVLYFDAE